HPAITIRSRQRMPLLDADRSDGMHFCNKPVVACSHAMTGRGPAGGSVDANTVATAAAGVLSFTVVAYRMRQPRMPAGSMTSLSGSLRSNAPGKRDRSGRVSLNSSGVCGLMLVGTIFCFGHAL